MVDGFFCFLFSFDPYAFIGLAHQRAVLICRSLVFTEKIVFCFGSVFVFGIPQLFDPYGNEILPRLKFPPDLSAFIFCLNPFSGGFLCFGTFEIYLYIGITSCDYKITHP